MGTVLEKGHWKTGEHVQRPANRMLRDTERVTLEEQWRKWMCLTWSLDSGEEHASYLHVSERQPSWRENVAVLCCITSLCVLRAACWRQGTESTFHCGLSFINSTAPDTSPFEILSGDFSASMMPFTIKSSFGNLSSFPLHTTHPRGCPSFLIGHNPFPLAWAACQVLVRAESMGVSVSHNPFSEMSPIWSTQKTHHWKPNDIYMYLHMFTCI